MRNFENEETFRKNSEELDKYYYGEKKIASVQEFINFLKILGIESDWTGESAADQYGLFFRGHYLSKWPMLPTALRRSNEISEYEKTMYYEAMTLHPNEFDRLSRISKLAKMQHYGWHTRLLDFTTKPLVALWFSCNKNTTEKGDGCVQMYSVAQWSSKKEYKSKILDFDSRKATRLACLSSLSTNEQNLIRETAIIFCAGGEVIDNKSISLMSCGGWPEGVSKVLNGFKNSAYGDVFLEKLKCKSALKPKDLLRNSVGEEELATAACEFERVKKLLIRNAKSTNYPEYGYVDGQMCDVIKQYIKLPFNIKDAAKAFKKLITEVYTETRSLESDNIMPGDLLESFILKTQIIDQRILLQGSVFLIFGLGDNSKDFKKVLIKEESKMSILKELDKLGINKATLFRDLTSSAEYIKEKLETAKLD